MAAQLRAVAWDYRHGGDGLHYGSGDSKFVQIEHRQ